MKDTGNSTELPIIELARRVLVPVEERVPHQVLLVLALARDVREELLAHLLDEPSEDRRERSVRPSGLRDCGLRLQEVRRRVDDVLNQQVVGHFVRTDRRVGTFHTTIVAY